MFAVGRAHDCAACITADEVHDGRHREIAVLVKEYQALIKVSDTAETPIRKKAQGPLQNVHNVANYDMPAPQHQDLEASSSTSASENKHHVTLSKAEQRSYKEAIKHEESLQKSAKNSERHTVSIRQSDIDIDIVTKTLHGNHKDTSTGTGHPLTTNQDLEDVIERNGRFVANIQEHKVYLRTTVRFARHMTNNERRSRKRGKTSDGDNDTTEDDSGELVNAVLLELAIDVSGSTRKRPARHESFCSTPPAKLEAVLQKLRTAIQEDLGNHGNEPRQTCIGPGGSWHYVGRPVFGRMMEAARKIDWKTGSIIKEGKGGWGGRHWRK